MRQDNFLRSLLRPRTLVWLFVAGTGYWVLRNIPFQSLWQAFMNIRAEELLLWAVINVVLLLVISTRWYLILRVQGYPVPFLTLAGYRISSMAVTMFTPGMQVAGDALQVRLAQKRHAVPLAGAVASVALERVLESFSNFILLSIGSLLILAGGVLGTTSYGRPLAAVAVFSAVGMGAYLVGLQRGLRPVSSLFRQTLLLQVERPVFLARAVSLALQTENQMGDFCRFHPGTTMVVIAFSVLQWAGQLLDYALVAHFLGFDLSLLQIVSTVTFSRLAFLAPVPGALGTLEVSQVFLMGAMGLGPGAGISFTLLLRGRDALVGGLGLGLAGLLYR